MGKLSQWPFIRQRKARRWHMQSKTQDVKSSEKQTQIKRREVTLSRKLKRMSKKELVQRCEKKLQGR